MGRLNWYLFNGVLLADTARRGAHVLAVAEDGPGWRWSARSEGESQERCGGVESTREGAQAAAQRYVDSLHQSAA